MHTDYYTFTLNQLKSGNFISIHSTLMDMQEHPICSIWFDSEHAETEIRKAIEDYERR